MVENDREAYLKASKDINYKEIKADDRASSYEKICARMIENYIYITNIYCTQLGQMLSMLKI